MNNIINNEQQSSLMIINNHTNDDNNTNDVNDCNNCQDDMVLVIAKQLFTAYCKYQFFTPNDMSSILLSVLLPKPELSSTVSSTPTSTTSTPSPSTIKTITSIITTFIKLHSQYIGTINSPNCTNHTEIQPNHSLTHDNIAFNARLFHTALLTNSPIIIDIIMPYINYDFTILDIPRNQIDWIKQSNVIHNYRGRFGDEIYPNNYILQAIVDATRRGYYQSIQHLINNYQVSPTIPICDSRLEKKYQNTNFLYYAAQSNNLQLIEYLLPLCIKSTNRQALTQLILYFAENGHLHLIKQFHNEYNIKLSELQDLYEQNILQYAVKSTNIELIDYIIEVIGVSPHAPDILSYAVDEYQWDNVKHLIIQYNVNPQPNWDAFRTASYDSDITPDTIDYIISTFGMGEDDLTQLNQSTDSPLYRYAKSCNLIALKHVVEKYNANPRCIIDTGRSNCNSLLHGSLFYPNHIKSTQLFEMVKYLCELGLDVNSLGDMKLTPIELLVDSSQKSNECRLPIFKLLLEHNAVIPNINTFSQLAVDHGHFTILQYLIETHQPSINVNNINIDVNDGMSLFHYVIQCHPSIDFISYLLSLNTIDINEPNHNDNDKTSILYAFTSDQLNIDIIKLLIQHGAKVTIRDWLWLIGLFSDRCDAFQFYQCLNYFQDIFGFTFNNQNSITPLLEFAAYQLKFRYSTIKDHSNRFNMVMIYRALIHHYKANVYEKDGIITNNTVFHHLAKYNHYELIQFTLLHSYDKPNIYLVNSNGETFLHVLVSNYNQWTINNTDEQYRKDKQQSILIQLDGMTQRNNNFQLIITEDEINDRYDNFQKVLDLIIDLL